MYGKHHDNWDMQANSAAVEVLVVEMHACTAHQKMTGHVCIYPASVIFFNLTDQVEVRVSSFKGIGSRHTGICDQRFMQ